MLRICCGGAVDRTLAASPLLPDSLRAAAGRSPENPNEKTGSTLQVPDTYSGVAIPPHGGGDGRFSEKLPPHGRMSGGKLKKLPHAMPLGGDNDLCSNPCGTDLNTWATAVFTRAMDLASAQSKSISTITQSPVENRLNRNSKL